MYLLGGDDKLLEYSHKTFDGITRQFTRYDCGHGHPMVVKEYEQGYDWMHQGEGYLFFYLLCMADPGNGGNVERAQRFAGFYLNEDPEALNYDAEKKLLKCPHVGSMGPAFRNFEKQRVYGYEFWKGWPLPFLDIPGCETTEDLKKPGMAEKMGQVMNQRQGRGDVACSLAATSLVTKPTCAAARTSTKNGSKNTSKPGSSAPARTTASCRTTWGCRARSASTWTASGTEATTAGPGPAAGTT